MKKQLIILVVACISLSGFAQIRKINTAKSIITWTGKKVTGEHSGILLFKEGSFTYKNKKLSEGTFTVNMLSLNNTDQSGKDKAQLEGHLKSSDFFNTEEFPDAKLVFKAIKNIKTGYQIVADLTIKGKTNPITFDLLIKGKTAKATVMVDRTKYGIQYGSGSFFDDLGDRTIYDEFELKIDLVF